ncbi:metal transporter Nramp5-like [Chenopodium quinoa]|uniref:Uncharacterized protein n=1 Tax=Chenopodium quinoa TaxID=63459 RepID=A0A803MCY4_CHEQI|nr:metal transporter Nramp5-like [Chenopodium quinoa]
MAKLIDENEIRRSGILGSSNRIVAIDVKGVDEDESNEISNTNDPLPLSSSKRFDENSTDQQEPMWRKFLSFVGPGFLVSMAYLDPGNLETDLQAGANHKYQLLWVVLTGLIFALITQSLAANLGVSTGKHLSEHCKSEYPMVVNYGLWLLAELAVVAADIPEVIATAFSLNILFQIPLWAGVLLTGLSTLLLLGIHRYGVRKLEILIAMFMLVMGACFFGEMGYVKPPAEEVIKGMFIPKLAGNEATADAIALLGASIMPHNLFLHSALVLTRKVPKSTKGINDACRYFLLESGFAFILAFLINVAVVSVSGRICSGDSLTPEVAELCSVLTLNNANLLLKNVLGRKSASIIYGIALFASGQSSTITGTYAGQYIMQGFLDIKMKSWSRNLMTRCISIAPSLIVSIIGGSSGAGKLIIITSMIASFGVPFALIPLLKFSGSSTKMGPHKNSIIIMIISWSLGLGIMGIDIYFLSTGFVGWLIHSSLSRISNVFIGIAVFPLIALYVVGVIYLMFRKDRVVTFVDSLELSSNAANKEDLPDTLP